MSENLELRFGKQLLAEIDDLLTEIEAVTEVTSGKQLLAEIDELCHEIDNGLETRKVEVIKWPDELKRKEAMDSEDPFVLNLLSMDENFNVRTLSACNPNIPEASLRRLAAGANDYVKLVIANNPNCPPDVLDMISETSIEQEVLNAVKIHPHVSAVTRYKIENRVSKEYTRKRYLPGIFKEL